MKEHSETSRSLSRRSFIDWILGFSLIAAGAGTLYPIARYLWPSSKSSSVAGNILAIPEAELPPGKAIRRPFLGNPIIIIRPDEKSIFALNSVCTHLGCLVNWDEKKMVLYCPCHQALFDYRGNVLKGPAPSPLSSYRVTMKEGKIVIEAS